MKHLLVTGASGNLGRELIQHFNFNDYDKIYLVGKREKINLSKFDGKNIEIFSEYDLSDENYVKNIFEQIKISKEDQIFVIHLVGGYTGGKFFWEYDLTEFRLMLDKNLVSAFLVSKFTAQKLKEGSSGSIIFISARLAINYEPKRSIYSISKSALNFLVKVIEVEGKEIDLTVNALAPKIILTEENKRWIPETDYSKYVSPEHIATQIKYIFKNYKRLNGNIFYLND